MPNFGQWSNKGGIHGLNGSENMCRRAEFIVGKVEALKSCSLEHWISSVVIVVVVVIIIGFFKLVIYSDFHKFHILWNILSLKKKPPYFYSGNSCGTG